VGEPNWIGQVEGLFSAIPVELRHFDAKDESDAWGWLGAKPLRAR